MFESAPDDDANWGKTFTTEKKLYKTSSSSSDSSDSSSDENNALITDIKNVFKNNKKKPKKSSKKVKFAKEEVDVRPSISRVQTARALKGSYEVQLEIKDLKNNIEKIEEQRANDMINIEQKLKENYRKIDELTGLLKQSIKKRNEKS